MSKDHFNSDEVRADSALFTRGIANLPQKNDQRPGEVIETLMDIDFDAIQQGALVDWSSLRFGIYRHEMVLIHLGSSGGADEDQDSMQDIDFDKSEYKYAIRVAPLAPGSLNPIENDPQRLFSDCLVRLHIQMLGEAESSPRLAVPVGRLFVLQDGVPIVPQSRWVILLDQYKYLWILKANAVDWVDVEKTKSGETFGYKDAKDVFPGLGKQSNQLALSIQFLNCFPGEKDKPLNVSVHSIERWATSRSNDLNIGDIGVPLLPSTFRRLMQVDLIGYRIPIFRKYDFSQLVHIEGYIGFRNKIWDMNPSRRPGRELTEAAWLRINLQFYGKWTLENLHLHADPAKALRHQQKTLRTSISQVLTSFSRSALRVYQTDMHVAFGIIPRQQVG